MMMTEMTEMKWVLPNPNYYPELCCSVFVGSILGSCRSFKLKKLCMNAQERSDQWQTLLLFPQSRLLATTALRLLANNWRIPENLAILYSTSCFYSLFPNLNIAFMPIGFFAFVSSHFSPSFFILYSPFNNYVDAFTFLGVAISKGNYLII